MDITAAKSLSHPKLTSCSASVSPSIFHSKASLLAHNSVPCQSSKRSFLPQLNEFRIKARKNRSFGPVHASQPDQTTAPPSSVVQDRWLLVPAGDGDFRHIGYKVKMPDAFEIASNEVTVGRLPEKADMVIPVATVSGIHARVQKKGENLIVTDLNSTNGTYVNEKKLRPGVATPASSGSFIIFGDIHLAMFRASKIASVEASTQESEESTSSSPGSDGNETAT